MNSEDKLSRTRQCPRCKGEGTIILKKKRSLSQNRYYWGVIIMMLAREIGEDKDSMHDVLRYKFHSVKKILPDQSIIVIGQTTTNLDTKGFENYLKVIRNWAMQEMGFSIPLPNQVTEEMLNQYEKEYHDMLNQV